jgi:hypothetical protein
MFDCTARADRFANPGLKPFDQGPKVITAARETCTVRAQTDRTMTTVVPANPEPVSGGTPVGSQAELAIWSLICAVLVLPPAGIIMGAIARRNMRASHNFDGGKLAWAAIIIGAIYTAFDAFLIYESSQRLADWIIGAVEGCVPLYIVLQIWFSYAWSGRWRIAVLAPWIVFVPVLIYALAGLAQGANLWPLPLIVLSPLGVAYLLGVRVAHAVVNRRAPP